MDEMKALVALLNDYAYYYYVLDKPKISDGEYDQLFDRLVEMEKELGVVLSDSPTIRVGGAVLPGFRKHTHLMPLYSLDKAKTKEELVAWEARIRKLAPEARESYSLEYKFDGLTINLTYDGGALVGAATRGDGYVGEVILEQVKTIKSIPLTIPFNGKMEVQGEAIMYLSDLAAYNKTAKEPLKNARNATAGALRNLDTKVTASRKLDAYFYQVGYIEGHSFRSHQEMLMFLYDNRFKVSNMERVYHSIDDIMEGIAEIEQTKDDLDFLIDGVVIKTTDYGLRRKLGHTDRFPRWAIAYKFAAEEMTTVVNDIVWDVGRTGRLTPTAMLEAIDIGGVTVKRATLNNIEDIHRKKVVVGSRVFVRRSNDVIPEILATVPGDEGVYEDAPSACPACGAPAERIGPNLFCPNTLSCKPQLVARIEHYVSRDAMNIENISEKTAELLYSELNIEDIAGLYDLTEEMLLELPGFKEKRANNIVTAIGASKQPELANFIYALGINNVGRKTARDLAAAFGTFEAFMGADMEALVAIHDIGEIVAQCIIDFFASEQVQETLAKLKEKGVAPKPHQKAAGVLEGKRVVITGTLEHHTRNELTALIEENGGTVQSSVGKSTDYLVAGERAGSKLRKAQALGTTVLSEQEILGMF